MNTVGEHDERADVRAWPSPSRLWWCLRTAVTEGVLFGCVLGGLTFAWLFRPRGGVDGSVLFGFGQGLGPGAVVGVLLGLLSVLVAVMTFRVLGRGRAAWALVGLLVLVGSLALVVVLGTDRGRFSFTWVAAGVAAATIAVLRVRVAVTRLDRQPVAAVTGSSGTSVSRASAIGRRHEGGASRWWLLGRVLTEGAVCGALLSTLVLWIVLLLRFEEEARRGVGEPLRLGDVLGGLSVAAYAGPPGAVVGVLLALLSLGLGAAARALAPDDVMWAVLAPTLLLGGPVVAAALLLSPEDTGFALLAAAIPVLLNAWRGRSVLRELDRRRAAAAVNS